MTTHSPGPWRADGNLVRDGGGLIIATCWTPVHVENAKLAGAATELAECAKRLAWLCNELEHGNQFSPATLAVYGEDARRVLRSAGL